MYLRKGCHNSYGSPGNATFEMEPDHIDEQQGERRPGDFTLFY